MSEMGLVQIWIWKHPATERVYASTTQPGPRARMGLKADGYKLYEVRVGLPDEAFVPENDGVLDAVAQREIFPVLKGDTLVFSTGRPGECVHVDVADNGYVYVKWENSESPGAFAKPAILKAIREGSLRVNP